jgi:hypothetical protein
MRWYVFSFPFKTGPAYRYSERGGFNILYIFHPLHGPSKVAIFIENNPAFTHGMVTVTLIFTGCIKFVRINYFIKVRQIGQKT